jgi:hypothetical protein
MDQTDVEEVSGKRCTERTCLNQKHRDPNSRCEIYHDDNRYRSEEDDSDVLTGWRGPIQPIGAQPRFGLAMPVTEANADERPDDECDQKGGQSNGVTDVLVDEKYRPENPQCDESDGP